MADDNDQKTDDLLDRVRNRRDDSLQWFDDNYYGEFVEVMKASKLRTDPIMVKGRDGKEKEDLTRTNVAHPDLHIAIRRNTARMTANPPTNRYIVTDDPVLFGQQSMYGQDAPNPDQVAEALSAWNLMQFNLSGELREHRLHVQQEETFGFSVMEHFWKSHSIERIFRYQILETLPRATFMQASGKFSDDEIQREIQTKGQVLGPDELPAIKARYGSEIVKRTQIPYFDGPTGEMVFVGDFFTEPGFRTVDTALYNIRQKFVEKDWIDDWTTKTYFHPETDNELPVFDKEEVEKLIKDEGQLDAKQRPRGTRTELRSQMWDSMGKQDPDLRRSTTLIPGRRFQILMEHTRDDDGRWQITFVANEKYVLNSKDPATGKPRPMTYPFDLCGLSMFTEFVGLPDLISGIGDSTPRLLRFLWRLRNSVANQRTDLVNNILRRPVFRKNRADLPDQPVERSQFRIYDVKDPSDFFIPNEPDIPAGAFETERAVQAAMAAAEPALSSMETGSNTSPGTGRTATAATYVQRNIEGMTAYKLDGLHGYNGIVAVKKLAMLQQMQEGPIKVPRRFIKSPSLLQAMGESASTYEMSPYMLQTPIEVLPEEGSTLPDDDEFRRMAAENLMRFAEQDPVVFNKWYAAKSMVKTMRGVDPAQAINPMPDANAPPPRPEMKVNITVSMKFETLQPATQEAILAGAGLPFNMDEAHVHNAIETAGQLGDTAAKVAPLLEPAHGGQSESSGVSKSGASSGTA